MTSAAQPSASALTQYGFMALPLAFAGLPLYLHIPDYYVREFGLSLGTLGVLLLILRLFDGVQDPLFGYLSDRFAHKRTLILTCGFAAILTGMGMVLVGPPGFAPVAVWFCVSILLAAAGLSVLSINLNMLGGFWQAGEGTRIKIAAWREAFGLGGLLLASILPVALGMPALFWVFAPLMVFGFWLFLNFVTQTVTPSKTGLPSAYHTIISRNWLFLATAFATHLAASFPAVLFIFYVRDFLMAEALTGLFLLLYFIAGAAFMPLWLKVGRTIGGGRAWLASMALACLTFSGAAFLGEGDIILFGLICVLSGAALGADLAIPPALLAERLERQGLTNNAASAYALMNLMPKLALAMAGGSAFLILDSAAFIPGGDNTPRALFTLAALYAVLPCLVKALAGTMLYATLREKEPKLCVFGKEPC